MKKLFVFALCMLLALPASAAKAVVGGRTWSYKVNAGGKSCTVLGVAPNTGAISIPSKIKGRTVSAIDFDCFENSPAVSVSIPAGVKELYGWSFNHNMPRLKAIKVASGNKWYSSSGGILFDKKRTSLLSCPAGRSGSYRIPGSVRTIGNDAFYACKALKKVSIPASASLEYDRNPFGDSGVAAISVSAKSKFYRIANGCLVTKDGKTLIAVPPARKGALVLPKSLTYLDSHSFDGCWRLTSVTLPASLSSDYLSPLHETFQIKTGKSKLANVFVAAGNKTYASVKGIVYSKDKKTLLLCPPGKKGAVKIRSGTRRIDGGAFECCAGVSSLFVPASVVSIGDWAFEGTAIKKISVPNKGVLRLAKDARLGKRCKATVRDKTPVYWIRLVSNGGGLRNYDADYKSVNDANGAWIGCAIRSWVFRGRTTALPANPFEKDGSAFIGWATTPNGGVKYKDRASVKNLAAAGKTVTLYAVWKPIQTTYKFNANGGSGSMSPLVVDDGAYSKYLPACAFTRDGWTFDHWSTEPDDSGSWYEDGEEVWCRDSEKDETVTLYAIWRQDDADCDPGPAGAANPRTLASVVSVLGNLPVDSLGDAPWTESESGGEPCAESGAIGDGGTSTLRAEVEGPGTLAFRWRTSSEEGRDIVFLSVDGQDVAARSGLDGDWATVSLRVEGDGPHVLSWTYAKDASGSSGDDRARLADVVWLPD